MLGLVVGRCRYSVRRVIEKACVTDWRSCRSAKPTGASQVSVYGLQRAGAGFMLYCSTADIEISECIECVCTDVYISLTMLSAQQLLLLLFLFRRLRLGCR